MPILALFADNDPLVAPDIHAPALREALGSGTCRDGEVTTLGELSNLSMNVSGKIMLNGANHTFIAKKSPTQEGPLYISDLHTSPELLSTISQWVVAKTA